MTALLPPRDALAIARAGAGAPPPELSDGEVNFLWWFMQGTIMDTEVRQALRQGWGLCERHTLGWLCVEAAFRAGYLHGPAILYAELMARACDAVAARRRPSSRRIGARLRASAPCHICALGYGPQSKGYGREDRLRIGRDPSNLRSLLHECAGAWQPYVCGQCAGDRRHARCREHLIDALPAIDAADLAEQARLVESIAQGAARYESSYRWELRGSDTVDDRGAFVAAVGWCCGWGGLLRIAASPAATDAVSTMVPGRNPAGMRLAP
jgi:hypothetical protein